MYDNKTEKVKTDVVFNDGDMLLIQDKGMSFFNNNEELDQILEVFFANPKTKKVISLSAKNLFKNLDKLDKIITKNRTNDKIVAQDKADDKIVSQENINDEMIKEKKIEEDITANYQNTYIILTMDDIRENNVRISKHLSWERTSYEFFQAFNSNESLLKKLQSYYNVVVLADMEGALVLTDDLSTTQKDYVFQLIFSPSKIEGETMNKITNMVETAEDFATSAFAFALMCNKSVEEATEYALQMSNVAFEVGVLNDSEYISAMLNYNPEKNNFASIALPVVYSNDKKYSLAEDWNILNTVYLEETTLKTPINIVKYGSSVISSKIPLLKINLLESVDRAEIENFRTISFLMKDYLSDYKRKKPMSIAVFGAPGTGKSFGIKQIINSLKADVQILEVNISQLKTLDDLENVFEQIRDIAIKSQVPIVFFDEFDSNFNDNQWGWIKYFLAPMQDGMYIKNGVPKPLGRGIYIFAGAVKHSYTEMTELVNSGQLTNAKVPDFLSRLKGYIDIISVNRPENKAKSDKAYLIKRALIMRSMLERYGEKLIATTSDEGFEGCKKCNIDEVLLKQLLSMEKYIYSNRSVEQIIEMSELKGAYSFTPSMLPPKPQLAMHIEGSELLK